jgi:hypothetical protein
MGIAKLIRNLCLGLEAIGQAYELHQHYVTPQSNGVAGILHGPIDTVREIAKSQPSVTGVGVLNFPDEWPNLFDETKTIFHLQSCDWAAAYYRPFFGNRVRVWAVGIDATRHAPVTAVVKKFDFLIYNKLRWADEHPEAGLREHCIKELERRGLRWTELVYGQYPRGREAAFHALLARSRAMLFLCENETQGIAYNEALSMGVPILAWNPGRWLDPQRHAHGLSECPASSVPYWDERCGEQFATLHSFERTLEQFLKGCNSKKYAPRDYVLENLTLEHGARAYVTLLEEAADIL